MLISVPIPATELAEEEVTVPSIAAQLVVAHGESFGLIYGPPRHCLLMGGKKANPVCVYGKGAMPPQRVFATILHSQFRATQHLQQQ